MKCIHCGNEIPENSIFCSFCGKTTVATQSENTVENNPLKEKLLTMFNDSLFLVLCILISASILITFANDTLPLLQILFTIFLWIIFAKSKKGVVDIKSMRSVSGTIYASYIILYVLAGIIALASVLGVIAILFAGNILQIETLFGEILSELKLELRGTNLLPNITANAIMSICIIVFSTLLIVVAGMVILNFFSMRNIHKFAKSLYISAQSGNIAIEKTNTASTWLLVFGILTGISAVFSLGDFGLFAANGTTAASYIIGHTLVSKYFKPKQIYIQQ